MASPKSQSGDKPTRPYRKHSWETTNLRYTIPKKSKATEKMGVGKLSVTTSTFKFVPCKLNFFFLLYREPITQQIAIFFIFFTQIATVLLSQGHLMLVLQLLSRLFRGASR